jgi:glycosyltransferase involved in cell wall biosynthesis
LGVDIERYRPIKNKYARESLGIEKDEFVIVNAGKINESKKQLELAKAIILLQKDIPQIRLVCI